VTLPVAVAIVVANMVGTGVFGSLGHQVEDIPSGFPIVLLWSIGGLVSFCGAVCYAELAAMMPRSGGEYHLLRETWHPAVGFLSGWVSATVGFAAPIAANAVLLGSYLADVSGRPGWWFSIPVVVIVTAIHLGNVGRIGQFQVAFTSIKIALIVALIGSAFWLGERQPVSFLPRAGDAALIAQPAFAISLVYVLYAYAGWNAAAYVTGELKNPRRTLPLAMLIGTAVVTLLYVGVNAAFLHATPIADMAGKEAVGAIAARSIFGERGGAAMGLMIAFGLISTISSMIWAGPRVTAVMGEDYGAFAWLAWRNRFGVPAWAILVQSVIVLILVVTARFNQLILYVQAFLTLSSLLTVIAVVWMRVRMPGAPRPYRAWGYPFTPAIFISVSLYVLYFQIKGNPKESLWGLATLAVGWIVYLACGESRGRDKKVTSGEK
jgi:APA family basic amino acid/polyamine antiporter